MIIAVIDDEVNPKYYPDIGKLAFDLKVGRDCTIRKYKTKKMKSDSHGTTCAAIIRKYAPEAQIGSIKVINDKTHKGKIEQLTAALAWCLEHNIKLVHMSVGSQRIRDIEPIADMAERINKNKMIIVAAKSNNGAYTSPACFDGVVGVRTGSIYIDDQFTPIETGLFEVPFAASSLHKLTKYSGEIITTSYCNSYAAPVITAKVHDVLLNEPELSAKEAMRRLGGKQGNFDERVRRTPDSVYQNAI